MSDGIYVTREFLQELVNEMRNGDITRDTEHAGWRALLIQTEQYLEAPQPQDASSGAHIQWASNDGVKHTMPIKAATLRLKQMYEEWPGGLREIRAEIERLKRLPTIQPFSGWVWRHKVRQTDYRLLNTAKLQTDTPLHDMAELYVYQGEDGRWWVRQQDEFNEKFTRALPAIAQHKEPGADFEQEQEMLSLCPHFGPSPARDNWIAGYQAATTAIWNRRGVPDYYVSGPYPSGGHAVCELATGKILHRFQFGSTPISNAPVEAALAALETNHQWHQDYDEHDGYGESNLETQNREAISGLRVWLDEQSSPMLLDQYRTALRAYEDAFQALFAQCLSNPIKDTWGREVSMSKFNDAHALASKTLQATVEPIPMVLHCPECGMQHIDRADAPDAYCFTAPDGNCISTDPRCMHQPNPAPRWENRPHKSHLCRKEDGGCGCVWRPADIPTVGVSAISTRGKDDTWPEVPQMHNDGGSNG